jgi:hypothetical protein
MNMKINADTKIANLTPAAPAAERKLPTGTAANLPAAACGTTGGRDWHRCRQRHRCRESGPHDGGHC